jgi:hypothetical protein
MVEEYLWECERLGSPRASHAAGFLRALAASLDAGPGAPAELGDVSPLHWERFLCFDRYRGDAPPVENEIAAELEAATDFAKWVRDEQGVDWFQFLTPILDRERADGPRLARANAYVESGQWRRRTGAFVITRVTVRGASHEVEVESIGGAGMVVTVGVRGSVALRAELASHLEPGDCVVVASDPSEARGAAERAKPSRRASQAPMGWEKSVSARLLRVLPAAARRFLELAPASQE